MAAEKFRYVRSLIGTGAPTLMHVVVGNSQTIIKGDLVMIDGTNGYAIKATAAATGVIGIATHAVTTEAATTANLEVVALNSNSVIVGAMSGSTVATAAMCWGKAKYDIIVTTQLIDFTDTTGGFLIPIKPTDSLGNTECVVSAAALWNA